MRFLLRSRQNIPTTGGDKPHTKAVKNEIRTQFHHQLHNLWSWTPYLRTHLENGLPKGTRTNRGISVSGGAELYCADVGGITFYPLVTFQSAWECEHIDVRFLIRKDRFDTIDPNIGDMDARLPTLFDALTVPKLEQLPLDLSAIPNPCFCLLEDDSLIQRIDAETLQLLNDPNVNSQMQEVPDQDHAVHVLVTLKPRERMFSLGPVR